MEEEPGTRASTFLPLTSMKGLRGLSIFAVDMFEIEKNER
jgi:hypothetical protein